MAMEDIKDILTGYKELEKEEIESLQTVINATEAFKNFLGNYKIKGVCHIHTNRECAKLVGECATLVRNLKKRLGDRSTLHQPTKDSE
jgi:hypothetical protein